MRLNSNVWPVCLIPPGYFNFQWESCLKLLIWKHESSLWFTKHKFPPVSARIINLSFIPPCFLLHSLIFCFNCQRFASCSLSWPQNQSSNSQAKTNMYVYILSSAGIINVLPDGIFVMLAAAICVKRRACAERATCAWVSPCVWARLSSPGCPEWPLSCARVITLATCDTGSQRSCRRFKVTEAAGDSLWHNKTPRNQWSFYASLSEEIIW